ncbi:tRNA lysidine(34) synthetase TilS [Aureibaculum luteum]|uniref:tRNA lysidine(34) synthetase TilS n=1 Tax=Aureibaculum luteum TaxID=1548456 RepID=UPI000E5355D9|nr:tRNA lysidine(34) synthetase TilS [Aureibaculum luteum]
MLDQFSEHIATNFSYLRDKKLLIAISGGVDSVVLAELLNELDFDISLAHCNFQLRGADANQDEVFVNAIANRIQIPVFTKKFETKAIAKAEKLSIQLAARELRYDWFKNLLIDNDLDYILTGHHADDNLETFLINLSRGTGLDGLTGIPEKNGAIVRPLLPFSRNQIEQYARKQNLKWREDTSNAETKYLRNKLRHDVIPALKSINPRFLDTFSTTIHHLQDTQQIVAASVENIKHKVVHSDTNGILTLDINELKKLASSKALLYELLKGYNFTAWNDIYNLLEAQAGKFVLSNSHRILKDRDFLIVSPKLAEPGNEIYTLKSFPSSIQTELFQLKITTSDNFYPVKESNTIFVDADQLIWPITLRKWQNGDYFYPFGMQGKKKLSKFFKDQKYSLFDKENTWVLISDDKIVWVIDARLDERFKVTDSTKTILKLELI